MAITFSTRKSRTAVEITFTVSTNPSGLDIRPVFTFNGKSYTMASGTEPKTYSKKFTNLRPGTEYSYSVQNYYKNNEGQWTPGASSSESITTVSSIAHWSWSSNIKQEAPFTALTKSAWKNFCERVYKCCTDAVGGYGSAGWATVSDQGTTLLTYEQVQEKNESGILYGDVFNTIRFQIGRKYSTGIKENQCEEGKEVKASYFSTLKDCLNNWIDDLNDRGLK